MIRFRRIHFKTKNAALVVMAVLLGLVMSTIINLSMPPASPASSCVYLILSTQAIAHTLPHESPVQLRALTQQGLHPHDDREFTQQGQHPHDDRALTQQGLHPHDDRALTQQVLHPHDGRALTQQAQHPHDHLPLHVASSAPSIVCHTLTCGGLGNSLFEYASVLGIARATNKGFYITNGYLLDGVLKSPPQQVHSEEMDERCQRASRLNDDQGGKYDPRLTQLEPGRDYNVGQCLQSGTYFHDFRDQVRDSVAFHDDVVGNASRVMDAIRRLYPDTIIVSIHNRRKDMVSDEGWVKHDYVKASHKFFRTAMDYFRQKFPKVAFVVLGEDRQWNHDNIHPVNGDVVILEPGSSELDMQMLSLADHIILSTGTFGWWSAFKNPGNPIVVYMKPFTRTDSYLNSWYSPDSVDYMMPHWVGL